MPAALAASGWQHCNSVRLARSGGRLTTRARRGWHHKAAAYRSSFFSTLHCSDSRCTCTALACRAPPALHHLHWAGRCSGAGHAIQQRTQHTKCSYRSVRQLLSARCASGSAIELRSFVTFRFASAHSAARCPRLSVSWHPGGRLDAPGWGWRCARARRRAATSAPSGWGGAERVGGSGTVVLCGAQASMMDRPAERAGRQVAH